MAACSLSLGTAIASARTHTPASPSPLSSLSPSPSPLSPSPAPAARAAAGAATPAAASLRSGSPLAALASPLPSSGAHKPWGRRRTPHFGDSQAQAQGRHILPVFASSSSSEGTPPTTTSPAPTPAAPPSPSAATKSTTGSSSATNTTNSQSADALEKMVIGGGTAPTPAPTPASSQTLYSGAPAGAPAPSAASSGSGASAAAPVAAPVLSVSQGSPSPLGPSAVKDGGGKVTGVNFALFSQHGTAVTLCLFLKGQISGAPDEELVLDATKGHRTGDVWHIAVSGIPLIGVNYAYRVDGPKGWDKGHRFDPKMLLVDPYAPLLDSRRVFGDSSQKMAPFVGTFDFESPPFDWGDDDKRQRIKEEDVVVYEMNVRAFTADPSSGLEPAVRGSYQGVADKVHHLVELGVNSVELLPIHEFDEFEFQRQVNPRNHMLNTWGYSTINFFAPMARYGAGGKGPVEASKELKGMIKTLHAAGIEVILDVVYNHTNEGDDAFPYTTSFKGIDCSVYYILDLSQYVQLTNYSGCGNTFNCNHPVVMELILDSLRHWVLEYHVDGFRFDLASILCRGTKGEPLQSPPLIRACAKDDVLSKVRLISEPWDCGGLYLVGRFPNWDKWAEWNGKYRDDVRRFIKGDVGMKGAFATRLSGSADLYNVNNRKPWASVNFVIAHDGFSLYDLVAYNSKHNEANGEGGRDGSNDNFSWNCGVEGPTGDDKVNALRMRQMKNFHLALMLSQGVPMMLMGDEYAHTRDGNNNSYGHDTKLNHFLWDKLEAKRGSLFRYFSAINTLRRLHPVLGQPHFLSPNDIKWHEDNWGNPDSRFLAFTLVDHVTGRSQNLYAAFNAHTYFVEAGLPPPPSNRQWTRLVDTNLPSPADVVIVESADGGLRPQEMLPIKGQYNVAPFSAIVLLAV